ncbi:hypothetical protein [Sphingobacterium litopenaei]|uniref:DEAD/DEAH box helicase n=1 Tax=Sphingobacterium litopenaei TaxID=2763500 RepID=A0ABR7YI03_9SPHI|nr:hypothetical protein [Sphingobacterium litopenaei]MBD1430910.1 hypothetical protein [Sphingobacterium litopenaei]
MNIKNIQFNNVQGNYLNNVLEGGIIPSNTIISKNITGIGATTTELNSKRHSIIIVESREIIDNKKKNNPSILAVREGIGVGQVKEYLCSGIAFYKIMITPESFFKLVKACEIMSIDLYNTFFILIDECDRIIKSADFRQSFSSIMDTFFMFKHKAMVTATFIEPSDPRFDEFTVLNIIPINHVPKKVNLCVTNNSILMLDKVLKANNDKKWLIFANSNKIIRLCIDIHGYHKEYSVFCGKDYVDTYKGYKLKHIETSISVDKFCDINFFTGRYFAGLDINITEEYNIIIISDPVITLHSILDPLTDVVQIIGRVRDTTLVKSINIITTPKEGIEFLTKDELFDHYESSEQDYLDTVSKRDKAVSINSKNRYTTIINSMPFADFVDLNGKKSNFLLDCSTYYNNVSSYYDNNNSICKAFRECSLYKSSLKHFEVNIIYKEFNISSDQLYHNPNKAFREKLISIVEIIEALEEGKLDLTVEFIRKYILIFDKVVELYNLKGREFLLTECTSLKDVDDHILEYHLNEKLYNKSFADDIKSEFTLDEFYSASDIKEKYKGLLEKHDITEIKATPKNYSCHIILDQEVKKIDGKTVRGYVVTGYSKKLQN